MPSRNVVRLASGCACALPRAQFEYLHVLKELYTCNGTRGGSDLYSICRWPLSDMIDCLNTIAHECRLPCGKSFDGVWMQHR